MKFIVLSLFPEIIDAYFAASIMAKAVERRIIEYQSINIREFAQDKHKSCDDAPYGGGAGMLLLPEPLSRALESAGVKKKDYAENNIAAKSRTIYLSPSGKLFDQNKAAELAQCQELILICGRYEGIDRRIIDLYVDEELSTGDYVLSSGEVAALVLIDAVHRLLDGVITRESLNEESFNGGLLEYSQWTRPEIFANLSVPDVLLSGHHEQIRRWRLEQRVVKTARNRPDLLERNMRAGLFDQEIIEIIKTLETQVKE